MSDNTAQGDVIAQDAIDEAVTLEMRPLGDIWTCPACGVETSITVDRCQKCSTTNPLLGRDDVGEAVT